MVMLKASAYATLIITLVGLQAPKPKQWPGSRRALQGELGASVTFKDARNRSVEYCPDNTCDVFTMRGAGDTGALSDFAFMYLFFVSEYGALEDFKHSSRADRLATVILARFPLC
jgi:hypothetical protein